MATTKHTLMADMQVMVRPPADPYTFTIRTLEPGAAEPWPASSARRSYFDLVLAPCALREDQPHADLPEGKVR
jgi:hypothetical protein